MIIQLGNDAPLQLNEDHELVPLDETDAFTTVSFPDSTPLAEILMTLTLADGIIDKHFQQGNKPTWVYSDIPTVATVLADEFGVKVHEEMRYAD